MAYDKDYFQVTINKGRSPAGNLVAQMKEFQKAVEKASSRYIELIAEVFVERAREKLGKFYPSATKFASYISSQRNAGRQSVQVRFYAGDDLPIMYYLEFGTGIRGGENPHEGLNDGFLNMNIKWTYGEPTDNNIYPNGPWFDLTKDKAWETGWDFNWTPSRNKGWVYKDQNGRYKVTSGLVPTQYLYDTYKEMEAIKAEAKRRLNSEQTLPRRRLIRR